jgi:hypothetical protein
VGKYWQHVCENTPCGRTFDLRPNRYCFRGADPAATDQNPCFRCPCCMTCVSPGLLHVNVATWVTAAKAAHRRHGASWSRTLADRCAARALHRSTGDACGLELVPASDSDQDSVEPALVVMEVIDLTGRDLFEG